jgi:hypothetical protein
VIKIHHAIKVGYELTKNKEIHNLTISKLGNHEILCHFDVILIIIYKIYSKERTVTFSQD